MIMARTNQQCAVWVIDLLDIQPHGESWRLDSDLAWAFSFSPRRRPRDMLPAWTFLRKWSRKPPLGMCKPLRVVGLTCGTALWSACHLKTIPSIRHWRLTPCKCGQTPSLGCEKCGESSRPVAELRLVLLPMRGSRRADCLQYSPLRPSQRRTWWRQSWVSVRWRSNHDQGCRANTIYHRTGATAGVRRPRLPQY
jgi:hypothetical protein